MNEILEKVTGGARLSEAEAYALCDIPSGELREAAAVLTARLPRTFDSCSIINARSGRCSENCKWCAQSAHYHTGCDEYDMAAEQECMHAARVNAAGGIRRFSLVASGKAVRGKALDEMCRILRRIKDETPLQTCASMGLLDREAIQKLWDSGVRRYHCNLETAPSHFETLCTTHTIEDKLRTIDYAREAGMEVCSGGIIGMGETKRQIVEFALTLRRACPVSIPINVLSPIPGTPLEHTAPITDDEILDDIAILRLVHPDVELRFAGGRARLSRQTQLEALRIGINGGIVGDLLTTIGSTLDEDKRLTSDAGYDF